MKKWYHNAKTGEIGEYNEATAGYELKGLLYAYGDAITTGLNSREEAIKWSKEWGYCEKCKRTHTGDFCSGCGSMLIYKEAK